MFEWKSGNQHFYIRDVESEAEYHAIEDIQKEAWGFNDLDTVPAATLIATQHAGGSVLVAFEHDQMIGFAYAFPALEEGRVSMHSHMLAVRTDYRNYQVGFYLKLAQRQRALEEGMDEITWTFDPLQSLNAHFNFGKLGVVSGRYLVNFYGGATSSPLHQGFGTDRLWVRWPLTSDRVKQRISRDPSQPAKIAPDSSDAVAIIQSTLVSSVGPHPQLADLSAGFSTNRCTIEIPHNINTLKEGRPELGREWRETTRAAFLAAIEEGFTVEDFLRVEVEPSPRWFYLLTK